MFVQARNVLRPHKEIKALRLQWSLEPWRPQAGSRRYVTYLTTGCCCGWIFQNWFASDSVTPL
jgi:hypothetical protein